MSRNSGNPDKEIYVANMIPVQNQSEEEMHEEIQFLREQVESLNLQLIDSQQVMEECYQELQIANNDIRFMEQELFNVIKSKQLEFDNSKELAKIFVKLHLDDIEFISELSEIISSSLVNTGERAFMSDLPTNSSSQEQTDIFILLNKILKQCNMLIEKHDNLLKNRQNLL
jgi:hypothetical protein